MINELATLSLPYEILAMIRGALFIQALWVFFHLYPYRGLKETKFFALTLLMVVASCVWGSTGDYLINIERPVGANSFLSAITFMLIIRLCNDLILAKQEVIKGRVKTVDGVANKTPLNNVRITGERRIEVNPNTDRRW